MSHTENVHPTVALFFHGLNTYDDDLLHVGPIKLGRMDRHIRKELEGRGIRVLSINGIGSGSVEKQVQISRSQIAEFLTSSQLTPGSRVCFLGNSMGGLVARALAHNWKNDPSTNPGGLQLDKILTWGTPHRGSDAADLIVELLGGRRFKFGFDIDTFAHYSTDSLAKFNQRYPLNEVAPELHFQCSVHIHESSPYFWSLSFIDLTRRRFRRNKPSDKNHIGHGPSDGFILNESQNWGRCVGVFRLDHFAQTGFFQLLPTNSQREKARKEFQRLCDAIAKLVKGTVEISDNVVEIVTIAPS